MTTVTVVNVPHMASNDQLGKLEDQIQKLIKKLKITIPIVWIRA
jgi:hypothetical protein